MNMEHVNKEFVENLYKFVSDIVGYTGLKGPSELLGEFNKLDMNEIIKNFCSVMGKFGGFSYFHRIIVLNVYL
jgi:hypothetical protein